MTEDADTRIRKLHEKARALFNEDLDETEIIEALQKDGIDAAYAKLIIENIRTDIRDRADFWKLIFMGSFFTIGGLLLNYFSYAIAVNTSSSFFYLYWGIVVAGISILIRAYFLYRR